MGNTHREKRHFFRHPISVPIQLRITDDKTPYTSESAEISLGGLSFLWPSKLDKGTALQLGIPVKQRLFQVKAKVVYSKEQNGSAHYKTGVSFTDFPSAFRARLAEEVIQILEYRKTLSRQLGHEIPEEEAARRWIHQNAEHFQAVS